MTSDYLRLPPYKVNLRVSAQAERDGVDWGLTAYGIPDLWKEYQGCGVKVGVLDSGRPDHPALVDAIVDSRNFSEDSEEDDQLGHGTHVAGTIAARSGMSKGIAPCVELVTLKVLGQSGYGSAEAVAKAVHFSIEAKCDIICMSLGMPRPNTQLHQAICAASQAGVVMVCAAGNDGGAVNFPAAFPETIAVGAVNKHGEACPFSCRGKEIIVAAPGEDITSTWLGKGYATLSGTSMAAPFVAGVLSLYIAAMKKSGAKKYDILKVLSETSHDAGDTGRDDVYGWGLLNPGSLLGRVAPAGITIFIPGGRIVS